MEFEEDYSDRRSDDPDSPLAVRLDLDKENAFIFHSIPCCRLS